MTNSDNRPKTTRNGPALHHRCTGEGLPTVILDAGLGDTSDTWAAVEPEIARFTRVLVYDRANLGQSSPTPPPRTSPHMLSELRDLLATERIEPPYLLVGHSFGAFNMMLFAHLFPSEVAGMVLVDGSHPEQFERYLAVLPPDIANRYREARERGINDEKISFEDWIQSTKAVKSIQTLSMAHLRVLARGRAINWPPGWPEAELEEVWRQMQRELAGLVPMGKLLVAHDSSHYIQREQPDFVVKPIQEIVEAVRLPATFAR